MGSSLCFALFLMQTGLLDRKLATALIQRGTLKRGMFLLAGTAWAKVGLHVVWTTVFVLSTNKGSSKRELISNVLQRTQLRIPTRLWFQKGYFFGRWWGLGGRVYWTLDVSWCFHCFTTVVTGINCLVGWEMWVGEMPAFSISYSWACVWKKRKRKDSIFRGHFCFCFGQLIYLFFWVILFC